MIAALAALCLGACSVDVSGVTPAATALAPTASAPPRSSAAEADPAGSPTASGTASPTQTSTAMRTATATPTHTIKPTPLAPPVIIAAGDIAGCPGTGDEATALLVESMTGTVAALGDLVYASGSARQYAECYDPIWGQFRDRTRPAPGNHDYQTPGADGYFSYFGQAAGEPGRGYYAYDLGAWHVVSLNSNCGPASGCGEDSLQAQWLKADLQTHPAACTLAYWHAPRFSSGLHGDQVSMLTLWDILYASGADVVLSGHDHDYERFAPQDARGALDVERGMRQFVVGTGGFSHYDFPDGARPNSQARNANTFGVLRLTLNPDSYDWEFVPIAGKTFTDSGSAACH